MLPPVSNSSHAGSHEEIGILTVIIPPQEKGPPYLGKRELTGSTSIGGQVVREQDAKGRKALKGWVREREGRGSGSGSKGCFQGRWKGLNSEGPAASGSIWEYESGFLRSDHHSRGVTWQRNVGQVVEETLKARWQIMRNYLFTHCCLFMLGSRKFHWGCVVHWAGPWSCGRQVRYRATPPSAVPRSTKGVVGDGERDGPWVPGPIEARVETELPSWGGKRDIRQDVCQVNCELNNVWMWNWKTFTMASWTIFYCL